MKEPPEFRRILVNVTPDQEALATVILAIVGVIAYLNPRIPATSPTVNVQPRIVVNILGSPQQVGPSAAD